MIAFPMPQIQNENEEGGRTTAWTRGKMRQPNATHRLSQNALYSVFLSGMNHQEDRCVYGLLLEIWAMESNTPHAPFAGSEVASLVSESGAQPLFAYACMHNALFSFADQFVERSHSLQVQMGLIEEHEAPAGGKVCELLVSRGDAPCKVAPASCRTSMHLGGGGRKARSKHTDHPALHFERQRRGDEHFSHRRTGVAT